MRVDRETQEQKVVARYISLMYPQVQFHSDYGSGARLTKRQAAEQAELNAYRDSYPDMFLAAPVNGSAGLYIELKATGINLYCQRKPSPLKKSKDGKMYATEHLKKQADVLFDLRQAGYMAEFAVGTLEAEKLIDYYLQGSKWDEGRRATVF